jgi:hypothetical protein
VAFAVAGTMPAHGSIGLDPSSVLTISFSSATDLTTVTTDNLILYAAGGTLVPTKVLTVPSNPRFASLEPFLDLAPDAPYRLVVKGSIRSADGTPLGVDSEVCFITKGPFPTIRQDQILDLGDRLNVPRYLAQLVRANGRAYVIGGFRNATEATDTIEEWDPVGRTFRLLPVRLLTPRAEFTATYLADGRILVAGGVSVAGGAPLATTEYLNVATGSTAGPSLLAARRWHAASRFRGGVLVSGGYGVSGDPLDTLEVLAGTAWEMHPGRLAEPSAQHLQFSNGFDTVYVTVGNFQALASTVADDSILSFLEGDIRFRSSGVVTSDGRVLIVGGDTRSISIHDFARGESWLGNDLLFDRRGAFSLTSWGPSGRFYVAAGGFQITAGGRAIQSLELVEYLGNLPVRPDVIVYRHLAGELPVPFAGHVGFNETTGATVLAGGFGDGVGDHSRRVVVIVDDRETPPATCR